MKIRLAKKILFSELYQRKHEQVRPPYWSEKKQRYVVPGRKHIAQIVQATKRYVRWYDHKIFRKFGIKLEHNESINSEA